MCRMLGKVFRSSKSGSYDLLDAAHSLYQQSRSSCQFDTPGDCGPHPSGCGIAWVSSEGGIELERRGEEDRWNDSFQSLIRELRTHAFIAHNRKASPGLKVASECSHPYLGIIHGAPVALCHNGGVRTFFPQAKEEGVSDSEILLRQLEKDMHALTFASYSEVMCRLADELDYSSLSNLLLTPQGIYAFRCYSVKDRDVTKNERYYTLHIAQQSDEVTIASEPVDTSPLWKPLANRSLVSVVHQKEGVVVEVVQS